MHFRPLKKIITCIFRRSSQ